MDINTIFKDLQDAFGEKILALDAEKSSPEKITVKPDALLETVSFLRKYADCPFDSLLSLSGVDSGEELAAVLHLYSNQGACTLAVEAWTERENPEIDSVASVYKTANWHEREAYDMYGIVFNGHPELTRMFLADDWEGHPLRKDYVPADYWHGMPIPKELSHKMK